MMAKTITNYFFILVMLLLSYININLNHSMIYQMVSSVLILFGSFTMFSNRLYSVFIMVTKTKHNTKNCNRSKHYNKWENFRGNLDIFKLKMLLGKKQNRSY